MESATVNGSDPNGAVDDPLAAHARSLEEMLVPIETRRKKLEAELADLTDQEARVNAAIEALTGKATAAKAKPSKPAAKPSRGISQKNLDDVYACVARASEPITYAQIQEQTEMTQSVVHNALRVLREQERIRIAGIASMRTGEGARISGGKPPRLYAVMP